MDLDGGHHNPISYAFLILFSTTTPTDSQPTRPSKSSSHSSNQKECGVVIISANTHATRRFPLEKSFLLFFFSNKAVWEMGWWELGFMEKEKLRLDMGAKGGQPFLLRDIVLFLPLFFFFFFIFPHQSTAPNSINTTTRTTITTTLKYDTDWRKPEYFFYRDSLRQGAGRRGNYSGEISLHFFLIGGQYGLEISQTWGSTRGGISSTLVRMKLDMTGLIVLFRLLFLDFAFFFLSTSRLLSFLVYSCFSCFHTGSFSQSLHVFDFLLFSHRRPPL